MRSLHPTISEVREYFPDAKIYGTKNCNVWLKYMMLRATKVGFLTGLIYLFFWKKKDNKPPYYECMVVCEKASSRNDA
jgi:hypothetical protein